MKTATFQLGYSEFTFTGPTWLSILDQLNAEQDLNCLCRQARMMGSKKDIKEVEKLEAFMSKCYCDTVTLSDFKKFSVNLSIGLLKCLAAAE